MGKVGGYNHLKQLGVDRQLVANSWWLRLLARFLACSPDVTRGLSGDLDNSIFVMLPIVAFAIALCQCSAQAMSGLPINVARLVTLVGFALCVFCSSERLSLVFPISGDTKSREARVRIQSGHWPAAFVLSGIGVAVAGGALRCARKLFRVANIQL